VALLRRRRPGGRLVRVGRGVGGRRPVAAVRGVVPGRGRGVVPGRRKERLLKEAEARAAGKDIEKKKPIVVKYGINHITQLVESGKAQLVVIAHDVDPIELVVWLPALCKKMGVPYCIVKGKARLGQIVHKKNATALALTAVKNEDQREFAKIVEDCKSRYNEGPRITWGGGILGPKSQHKMKMREKQLQKELAQRAAV